MQIINKVLLVATLFAAVVIATPKPAEDVRCVCITDPCPCAKQVAGL